MVNLKDKVKKLTVIYICFFAICALFYFVAGDQNSDEKKCFTSDRTRWNCRRVDRWSYDRPGIFM